MKRKLYFFLLVILLLPVTFSYAQQTTDQSKAQELRSKIQQGKVEISNYNTACYFALAGDQALAFAYLKKAVYTDGFSNLKGFRNDTDLISLHTDTLWDTLLKAVTENGSKNGAGLFFNQPDFWESKTLKTPYKENITADEKVAGLSKLWSEAKYNFVNFDLIPALNFDSLYYAYLPKVKETPSTFEYYKLMTEFIAQLKDGHTNVFPPRELENEVYSGPLLRSRLVEDKILIDAVLDADLEKQGIKTGQEIITINGLPVKEYAAKYVTPYQSASTPQDLDARTYEYYLLLGSANESLKLQLKDKSGRLTEHTVARIKPADKPAGPSITPFVYKMLKGNIAYIALNSFDTDSAAKAFANNYAAISKASAIIFDVRNNGGGNSSVGWNIIGYLVNQPAEINSWYTREYKPSYRAWGIPQQFFSKKTSLQPNKEFYYDKRVVVLTGSKTYSAAEDFASAFKSFNRGLIIGKPTGGSTGQPLRISLPGGLSGRICTKRDKFPNGDDFVGKGVQPDKLVEQTVADFRKGIDTELEFAIKELTK